MTGSIAIRRAESDADLERWRQVRMAVVPGERTETLEEIRSGATPERLLLLAELDGEPAGSGFADRSDLAGQGSLAPRVLPHARRRARRRFLLARRPTRAPSRRA